MVCLQVNGFANGWFLIFIVTRVLRKNLLLVKPRTMNQQNSVKLMILLVVLIINISNNILIIYRKNYLRKIYSPMTKINYISITETSLYMSISVRASNWVQ